MFYLLGPLAVRENGQLTRLQLRPKALGLLARLALAPGTLERAELAQLLFGDSDKPRAGLRWHVNYLRSALPAPLLDALHVSSAAIGLDVETDVAEFAGAVARICADPKPGDTALLALYRDDLCAGLTVSAPAAFDTWLYVEQDHLRRQYRQATLAFTRWATSHNAAADAIPPLTRLVSVDPYFEEGHVLLIGALEADGREHEARHTYERYQRVVRDELHAQPRASVARRYDTRPPSGPTLPVEAMHMLREITMHVVEWPGGGPSIVAIHGSAGNAYSLTALGERLAPAVRFVAVDLRGHGFSDKPPHDYSLQTHVSDLRQLIDAMHLERPIVLGHSLGGAVAALLASCAPVGGLILLDGVVGSRAFTENAAAQVVKPFGADLERRFGGFAEYHEHWHETSRGYEAGPEGWIARFARYELAPLPDGSYRMRGLRNALEAEWASAINTDTLAALSRTKCPVLLVRATRPWLDGRPYLSDAVLSAQRRAAPWAQHYPAANCDHESLIRDPDADLIAAIHAFALP